ncbi:MAG: hypothetical protein ACE363_00875 [Alphaproteobacteria bacterium]
MSHAITTVLVRLFAAYVIFQGVAGLASYVSMLFVSSSSEWSVGPAAILIPLMSATLLFGIMLWIFARPMATWAIGEATPEAKQIDPGHIVGAGTFLIGLWWVGQGLWLSASLLALVVSNAPSGSDIAYPIPLDQYVRGPSALIIGLLLIVGSGRISKIYKWLRTSGR